MPAFEGAVRLGFEYVETDVHLTADGVLVAFHDDVLDRVTDRRGAIADMPWSAVRDARVNGVEPIPLLEDLLGAFPIVAASVHHSNQQHHQIVAAIQRGQPVKARQYMEVHVDATANLIRGLVG